MFYCKFVFIFSTAPWYLDYFFFTKPCSVRKNFDFYLFRTQIVAQQFRSKQGAFEGKSLSEMDLISSFSIGAAIGKLKYF